MNLFELNFLYSSEGETGGGNPQAQTEVNPQTEAEPQTEANPQPEAFKTFKTEEEYNNFVKSERSKAQHGLLKELGVEKLDEAKTGLTKYASLQNEHSELQNKHTELNEQYLLDKAGVNEKYREDALILAKAKVTEDVKLEDALKETVKVMPFLVGKGFTDSVGGERKTKEDDDVTKTLSKKYPWLK